MASKPVGLELEDVHGCSFCQESNPDRTELALLPCKHRLCAHCLQQLSSASAAVSGANCPSCLATSEAQKVGRDAESPVPNPIDDRPTPSLPTCANKAGEHGPATVFCTDCNKYYCEKCSKNHELFDFLRDHNLRLVDDMSAEDVEEAESSACQEHNLPRNIWCRPKICHQMMCPSCGLFEHKDHRYQKLADALCEAQRKLESIIKEVEVYMTKQEKNVAELEQTQNDIKTNIQSAKKAVEKAAQKLRDVITKHESDLVSDLDRHEADVLSKLKSIYEESKNKITVARALKQNAESVSQIKKPADKVEQAATLQEQQYGMTNSQFQKLRWKLALQQGQLEKSIQELFGKAELNCNRVSPDPASLGDPLKRVALVYDGQRVVSGMMLIDSWLCITHYDSPNLRLYNITSDQKQVCPIQGLSNPRGMTFMKTKNIIAITDECTETSKLHLLKLSADVKITDHKVQTIPLQDPRKITFSENTGDLLIGEGSSRRFVVLTKEGDIVKQKPFTGVEKSRSVPFCVIGTEEGYAVLIREKNGSLAWVDRHGNMDCGYGSIHEELLNRPRHFVMNKHGDLIIADSGNNRVLLVEGKRKPYQVLLTSEHGLFSPDCLYLDEEAGRLHVAHGPAGSVEVRVYRWPPVSNKFSTIDLELDVHLS